MGWTAPRTWVTAAKLLASQMNEHVRDNLRYLKGLDGVPTIESGLIIDNTDGDEYVLLPLLTTVECTSVLGAEGKLAFDEETHGIKYYNGSAVISLKDLATAFIASQATGDIVYASSATAWARLGVSTDGKILQLSGGVPTWQSPTYKTLATALSGSWVNGQVHAAGYDYLASTSGQGILKVTITGDGTATEVIGIKVDGTDIYLCPSNTAVTHTVMFSSSVRIYQRASSNNPCSAGSYEGNYGA